MGEKVLFLGLKNGGNRVLFSNLASGGAAVAPPPLPGLAPPPLCERQAAPARAPGLPRGLLTSLRGKKKKTLPRPMALSSTGPAPTARPGWGRPFPPGLAPCPASPGRAKPGLARGGRSPGWPRGSSAGPVPARPRIPGVCKHGSQRYTTPSSVPRRRPHAYTLLWEGPRRVRSSKFVCPHPTAFPGRPRGPAGAKELIPARSLPPPRLPAFPFQARELRPSLRRGR